MGKVFGLSVSKVYGSTPSKVYGINMNYVPPVSVDLDNIVCSREIRVGKGLLEPIVHVAMNNMEIASVREERASKVIIDTI